MFHQGFSQFFSGSPVLQAAQKFGGNSFGRCLK
jgi:hypothetical protein